MITYEQYKLKSNALDLAYTQASKAMNKLTAAHRGPLGLVSDASRATEPYIAAKLTLDKAFAALRSFNGSMPPEYKQQASYDRRYTTTHTRDGAIDYD